MITKDTKIRIARPTDNLAAISRMYVDGLGFKFLGSFEGHNGFDVPYGDFRDWPVIRAWAGDIAATLASEDA